MRLIVVICSKGSLVWMRFENLYKNRNKFGKSFAIKKRKRRSFVFSAAIDNSTWFDWAGWYQKSGAFGLGCEAQNTRELFSQRHCLTMKVFLVLSRMEFWKIEQAKISLFGLLGYPKDCLSGLIRVHAGGAGWR